jgi:energy-coupling factor transport system permease protein
VTPAVTAPLAGSKLGLFNPAAKLASAFTVMVGLLVTADLVSASVLLMSELLVLPLAGISARALVARAWPLPLAAAGVAAANFVASDASPATIGAISLRLLAIAIPGLLVFASTEAVDLADSLVQQLHVPARFAYGALAALRLLPILSSEWVTIRRARRARGIDPGRSPARAVQLFASAVYALLIAAIRRGARLALAMDSRGFSSGAPRTAARQQKVRAADWALVAGAVAMTTGANALAVVAGTWHPLLG